MDLVHEVFILAALHMVNTSTQSTCSLACGIPPEPALPALLLSSNNYSPLTSEEASILNALIYAMQNIHLPGVLDTRWASK